MLSDLLATTPIRAHSLVGDNTNKGARAHSLVGDNTNKGARAQGRKGAKAEKRSSKAG